MEHDEFYHEDGSINDWAVTIFLMDTFDRVDKDVAEQFGCTVPPENDLPEDEMDIIHERGLNHAEKMIRLNALRASKRVKPKPFSKRMTKTDRLHAKGMGIRLD